MGSSVYSSSNTSYANTPVTVSDNENPLTLTGSSGNSVGSTFDNRTSSVNGSTVNTLDGGAIKDAFSFGSQAITALADLTKQFQQSTQQSSTAALGFSERAQTAAQTLVDKKENATANTELLSAKTLWIVAGVVGIYFAWKAYK